MVKKPTMGKALKPKTPRKKIKAQLPVVESAVATETQSGIVIGVLMICAVALLVVFGSSFMAGIIALTNSAPLESNESQNDFDLTLLPKYEYFTRYYGDIKNVKFFDVYNSSIATYNNYKGRDVCMKDTCTGTTCASVLTTSCTSADKNCRLKEFFVFNAGTYSSSTLTNSSSTLAKVGNWTYNCPNGCNNGACIKPTSTPACTDSDGGINGYVKGITRGKLENFSTAPITTKEDFCYDIGGGKMALIDYYCFSNGYQTMTASNVNCVSGCVNGACIMSTSTPISTSTSTSTSTPTSTSTSTSTSSSTPISTSTAY